LVHFKINDPFEVGDVPFYLLLGILTGFISLYFNRATHFITEKMEAIRKTGLRIAMGAVALGILIFLFPAFYGEGYDAIRMIITGNPGHLLENSFFYTFRENTWFFFLFLVLLILFKVIATTLTIESGGVGGIFAPSAVTGGFAGFAFARLFNDLDFTRHLSEANFTLVGMAGVLGAVLHAPLTAIFLIAEMTNGYEMIVPLMVTSTISFITIKTFDPHSIFTKRLAERGELLTHHKDQAVLTLLNIRDVIDKDVLTVNPTATLGEFTKVISKSKRNLFAVVDREQNFKGMLILDDVREDMFNRDKYGVSITKYMFQPPASERVSLDETMESVMEKFKNTGNYNLLVLNKGKFVGFVSRANVFNAYRQTLIDVSHE